MSTHPILGQIALAYSPVIDRNRIVTATRLTVFPLQQGTRLDAADLLRAIEDLWPAGGNQLWLNVLSESLLQDLMQAQPASNVAIEIPSFMATDPDNAATIIQLHANGNTLLLKGRPLTDLPREILPCFKISIIDLSDDRRIDPHTGGAIGPTAGVIRTIPHVQSGITTVSDMEASFRRGALSVLGWPIDDAIQTGTRNAEQPALQAIVQLIDQVHKEADIEVLETTLKRDPPLAYKLLRYINSPGFGLSVEISSFRHAIMVLGYQRLKRWLALLLATASKDPNMRPVMFAAVRRGLLMEELARDGGSQEIRNELFICGVFSLLDQMFKQPFSELLKTIPVPEQVYQALVDGTGAYEPYFRMVKAIEGQSLDDLKEAADGLFMSPDAINVAVLHAMANATSLD
ncbi:MAG TPA: HDOD domain-containing protein [Aquabacterium sp.]|nr:HDOD domain-containing protein [Aquabacterium sp.]HRH29534.1 HDOD domain-containing protein [Aquabacterium sp.]